ncbi:MAG: flagellar protein FlgN [Phycisphaerales bacterium]
MNSAPAHTSRPNPDKLIAILEQTSAQYRAVLALIRDRREAIRTADFARFAQLGNAEQRAVAEIGELDRARLAESRALAVRLAMKPEAKLSEMATKLGGESGARLESVRAALRELIDEVKRESGIVRQAAERLSAHMAGILQTVHSALAHANLYSRGGRIAVGANVMSSLDIKS